MIHVLNQQASVTVVLTCAMRLQTRAYMASCGWRVLDMVEMRDAAPKVAPGFQCHFYEQERSGDFLYYFVTAMPDQLSSQ